jgi:hypothetical protein
LGKNIEDANVYRIGHPLAQRVVEQCKNAEISQSEVVFDLTNSGKIISNLNDFKEKTGWLQLQHIEISSFETEDYLLFAASTNEGNILDNEQCQRLFSLPAEAQKTTEALPYELKESFMQIYNIHEAEIIDENAKRNNTFFDDEVDKLEKWAEDVRNSLKFELKELEKEIKGRKTEARKLINLEQKVREQRIIKELEKRLAEKRMKLYESEDEIDNRKERMLDDYEKRLKQQIARKTLFTIKWRII